MKNEHQGRIWDDKIRYYREMTKDNDMWTKCRVFKIKQLEPEWKPDFKMWMAPEAKKRFGKSRPPSSKVKLLRYFRCSVSRGHRFVSPFLAQLRDEKIYRNGLGTRLKQSFKFTEGTRRTVGKEQPTNGPFNAIDYCCALS